MKRWGLAVAALAAAAVVVWFLLSARAAGDRVDAGRSLSRAEVAVDAPVDEPTPPAAVDAGAGLDAVPLPPADAPFSTTYAALRQQADAGGARAACRLAFELMRCEALLNAPMPIADRLLAREAEAADAGMPDGADMLAAEQIDAVERAADCRTLPPAAFDDASDYLFRAAAAGVTEARVRYVSGQMFGAVADRLLRVSDAGYLHHREFDRWRRTAPRMIEQLRATHPSIALALLADAYAGDERPFDALIPDDPQRAWAYVEAIRRANGAPPRASDHFDAATRARLAEIERGLPALPARTEADEALLEAFAGPGSSLGESGGATCE